MTVMVHLFAAARTLAKSDGLSMELPTGADVCRLREQLLAQCPALRELLPRCAIAVNLEYADDATTLKPGDELAIIPPVSGGES